MRLFPAWARELDLGEVRLVGYDLPLHAGAARYREAVGRIKSDRQGRGALVTTHKIDLFEACRDMFDAVDQYARLCGETSCLAKRGGQLLAFATDPISSGRALGEFYPEQSPGDVLCLGGGGSAVAITVNLIQRRAASHITVVNRTAGRLEAMRDIHARLGARRTASRDMRARASAMDGRQKRMPTCTGRGGPSRDRSASSPSACRRVSWLIGELPPGSLVINATGMGKDTRGSPITDGARFPEAGYAWELNYRGDLEFLDQALRQQEGRHLHVEDGWRYFIHGWAVVMEHVFKIDVDGAKIARLAAVSEAERPTHR